LSLDLQRHSEQKKQTNKKPPKNPEAISQVWKVEKQRSVGKEVIFYV